MKIRHILFALGCMVSLVSCDEDEILNEVPLDFLTAENAYTTPAGINSALTKLHNRARNYAHVSSSSSSDGDLWFGTDVVYHARSWDSDEWSVYNIQPDNSDARNRWQNAFKMVFGANVIIDRLKADSEYELEYANQDEKDFHLGEALFFRAWSYRYLTHLFGDVPLVVEEVKGAKKDYVRAPKSEVLAQMVTDLEMAVQLLPNKSDIGPGRLNKQAASHVLAETYLAQGANDKAIAAATAVISNPNFELMTERFGSRQGENGDVFWDLFRLNNQNLAENTEAIWVFQDEYPTPGGDSNARWERALGGEYNRYVAKGENEGKRTFVYESTYHGGRGQGYMRPTSYVTHTMWNGDWDTDIRNANTNILRKYWIDNPESAYYNDTIDVADPADMAKFMGGPRGVQEDTTRYVYPIFLKFSRINNHETDEMTNGALNDAQMALATPEHIALVESFNGVGPKMTGGARRFRVDTYAIRLAETYLIRAEAYIKNGNVGAAANDINVVRSRAGASLVSDGDVDMDYLLDERLRELIFEEPRRLTLSRLGLLYDRTSRFNDYAGPNVKEHHNLYPVPLTEIQANTDAELTQNPGY